MTCVRPTSSYLAAESEKIKGRNRSVIKQILFQMIGNLQHAVQ